jgi:energy-coupling factor transporter ATP-binding protein EcfA2
MARMLSSINVVGLFGMFDHVVDLNKKDGITIVTAPNGFGKTVLLRLTNAFFSGAYFEYVRVNFHLLTLEFDDGSKITIEHDYLPGQKPLFPASEPSKEERPTRVNLKLERPKLESQIWTVDLAYAGPLSSIDRYVPNLDQIAPRLWEDSLSGRRLNLAEVVALYGDRLPHRTTAAEPDWLAEFRKSIRCQFIETQRILKAPKNREEFRYRDAPIHLAPVVSDLAVALAAEIKTKLTEYATLSQSLDSTFPHRLIGTFGQVSETEPELRLALSKLDLERNRLMEAGLLNQETSLRLSDDKIEQSILNVLAIYVKDTQDKLKIFDVLYRKIDLLKRILNARLKYKSVYIARDKGFGIKLYDGSELNLEGLSSGEQHELVLIYELLFNSGSDSLILIDEPELSLHVAWQTEFIADLQSIIELSNFTVVIATHSPQIINDRWDLTTSLRGPEL